MRQARSTAAWRCFTAATKVAVVVASKLSSDEEALKLQGGVQRLVVYCAAGTNLQTKCRRPPPKPNDATSGQVAEAKRCKHSPCSGDCKRCEEKVGQFQHRRIYGLLGYSIKLKYVPRTVTFKRPLLVKTLLCSPYLHSQVRHTDCN